MANQQLVPYDPAVAAANSSSSTTPGVNPPSDPIVTKHKLVNYLATPDGQPDEGIITYFESKTIVTNLDSIGFGPTVIIVAPVSLLDPDSGKASSALNNKLAEAVKNSAMAVFAPANKQQGPVVGTSDKPFPIVAAVESIEREAARVRDTYLPCHPPDPSIWHSVLSGASDFGNKSGGTVGFYGVRNKFGVWQSLYIAVQSTLGSEAIASFRSLMEKRIADRKLTYGQLADSGAYKELLLATRRNAYRLLTELLVDMGLSTSVPAVSDKFALSEAGDTASRLVDEEAITAAVMSDVLVRTDDNTVAFFSRTVPYGIGRGIVSVLHPVQGLAIHTGGGDCPSDSSKGYPLTPKYSTQGGAKYEPEVLAKSYVTASPNINEFVASREFDAVDVSTLPKPPGIKEGCWTILEPIAVMAD